MHAFAPGAWHFESGRAKTRPLFSCSASKRPEATHHVITTGRQIQLFPAVCPVEQQRPVRPTNNRNQLQTTVQSTHHVPSSEVSSGKKKPLNILPTVVLPLYGAGFIRRGGSVYGNGKQSSYLVVSSHLVNLRAMVCWQGTKKN